jgi:hypothetical protein
MRQAVERVAKFGNRVVAVASTDKETVLIYGRGSFDRWDFPPGVGPLSPEDDKYREIAEQFEAAERPDVRKHLRVLLAMKDFTPEQMAEVESDMDKRSRLPMEERVAEYWREDKQVAYVRLDDGSEVWDATFGPEATFESHFVKGRTVVEVPFLGSIPADAE